MMNSIHYYTFLNAALVVRNDAQTLYQESISISLHLLINLVPSIPASLASDENEKLINSLIIRVLPYS